MKAKRRRAPGSGGHPRGRPLSAKCILTAGPRTPLAPDEHDPRIAVDWTCFEPHFTIDAIASLVRSVGLPLDARKADNGELQHCRKRYENPDLSFSYIVAAMELWRLREEANYRALLYTPDSPWLPRGVDPVELHDKSRHFVSYLERLMKQFPDEHPLVGEFLVLLTHLDAFVEDANRIAEHWQRKREAKPKMEFARVILEGRPATDIETAKRRLGRIATLSEAARTLRYLSANYDSWQSLEGRAKSILRGGSRSRSGQHNSVLAEFIGGELGSSFEFLFNRSPGGSTQAGESNASSRPYGHCVRFVDWVLIKFGHPPTPANTIATYLSDRERESQPPPTRLRHKTAAKKRNRDA